MNYYNFHTVIIYDGISVYGVIYGNNIYEKTLHIDRNTSFVYVLLCLLCFAQKDLFGI